MLSLSANFSWCGVRRSQKRQPSSMQKRQTNSPTHHRIFHTNVLGPHLVVRAVLPHLNPHGSNRLISISSVNARIHAPRWAFYSASKNALESLTRNWAKELAAKYRLTANSVVVGPTETERAATDPRGRAVAASLATADKRIATKEDVADVVSWLAGEESRWVNGDAIGCHGGAVFGS